MGVDADFDSELQRILFFISSRQADAFRPKSFSLCSPHTCRAMLSRQKAGVVWQHNRTWLKLKPAAAALQLPPHHRPLARPHCPAVHPADLMVSDTGAWRSLGLVWSKLEVMEATVY